MDARILMDGRNEQTIIYVSFPQINDLCCAICEIDSLDIRDSTKSNYHWQAMKCRLLIFLNSEIIASPVMGTEKYIFVIVHKSYFETGKLQKILTSFKLMYQGLRPVTSELYKSCLVYTIQAKIAPLWNKVGDYLVQGNNFYNSIGRCNALTLDVLIDVTNVLEKNMALQLHAVNVRIPYIKLEDYLPPLVISQFLADPTGHIDLSHYNLPFVHVLPSMKKGKVLSVSKKIPERSVFKDYMQLRRHWKNMYGYSLPKESGSILYYEIKFLIARSKIFTYPNVCVACGPLDIFPTRDKEPIVTNFLSDMHAKLPTVCNKQLQISKCNISSIETVNIGKQLEHDGKHIALRAKDINAVSKSMKRQLTTIHEIHKISSIENTATRNLDNSIAKQNGVRYLDTVQSVCTRGSKRVSKENYFEKDSNCSSSGTQSETMSKYFKIQKLHPSIEEGEVSHPDKKDHLTVKEKLLKAKMNEKTTVPSSMDNCVNPGAVTK